ncbi:transporter substrate-binding domain-containing protein [Thioclava sp.]|uniref:transporter substrate-binding domain-containing protein n=1 Tax=Thioclava sp. TaxID=1933450 RepID=UPI003AA94A95
MKNLIKIAAAASGLIFAGLVGASAETLQIGTEGAYAPFNYVAENGDIRGFDVEIGNAICAEMGVDCEWSVHDWGGIIPALNANKFDFMVASMAITEKRMEKVLFSDPYYYNAMRFLAVKDLELEEATPQALKGLVVGTQQGAVAVSVLEAYFPDSELKLYPKMNQALMDIESGRLDLALFSQFTAGKWLPESDGCCEFVGQSFLMDGTLGAGIAFRKQDEELRDRVNTALHTIMENGTYEEIRARYFDFDIMSKPPYASELFEM